MRPSAPSASRELTAARHLADQTQHLADRAGIRGRVHRDDVVAVVRALGALLDSLGVTGRQSSTGDG